MIQLNGASAPPKAARGAARVLAIAAAAGFFCGVAASSSLAADYAYGPARGAVELEAPGVACSIGAPPWEPLPTAATLPWPSVWLGHFSGGRPFVDAFGQTLVDWRDEKLCFDSRAKCQAWIHNLRRAYHRPEGYWTCLLLR